MNIHGHKMVLRRILCLIWPLILHQLEYRTPAVIYHHYHERYIWLVENGCQGPFVFSVEDIGEENGIEVYHINKHETPSTHPCGRDVRNILELLKELSGKQWCLVAMADRKDDFYAIDDLDEWDCLKDKLGGYYQKLGDGTWQYTFDMPEDYAGGGNIIALSEQDILQLL